MRALSGWGRYPVFSVESETVHEASDVAPCLNSSRQWIARGLGRSYGDSSLGKHVLMMTPMDRCLSFNEKTGALRCEAGTPLSDILSSLVPKGWFLPVTPGTRHVTVGGAIAADVHGKNHHIDGCFSKWIKNFSLMLADGSIVNCSTSENQDLFFATCGGMGLTGVILQADIQLRRIKNAMIKSRTFCPGNLKEIFDGFEKYSDWQYLVAWVDCLGDIDGQSQGRGRSLLFMGEHADKGGLQHAPQKEIVIPDACPGWLLNKFSARVFNMLYYRANQSKRDNFYVPAEKFFYPLDKVANWNRLYGKKGMLQYQIVLPKESSYEGLRRIFLQIRKKSCVPFLSVLKLLGDENNNLLSFPISGYTLALDFKAVPEVFTLLDELDAIVVDHGGRVYLAKDARMSQKTLEAGYPQIDEFRNLRDKYKLTEKFCSLQSERLKL